jgi:type VI protein secretion system component VasF
MGRKLVRLYTHLIQLIWKMSNKQPKDISAHQGCATGDRHHLCRITVLWRFSTSITPAHGVGIQEVAVSVDDDL